VNLLEIKNLSVGFHTGKDISWAVKDVNLSIQRGKTLALVGESGGGKTITALAITQLLPQSARVTQQSQILLDQKDLLNLSEKEMQQIRGRRIGMIFQEAMVALNPVLTIGQQMEEVLKSHFRETKAERKQRILTLLSDVGLKKTHLVARSYPHQLSGGMRQRAMIAIALAGEPDLLIADEPTTALDVTIQAQVLKLLKKLQQKMQMSLLFITHDLGVVAEIADQVAVIYHGKIVETANKAQFFSAPQSTYSQQLFAAIPSWQKREHPPKIPSEKDKPLLKVQDLRIYFPIHKGIFKRVVGYVKSVDGISFSLYPGNTLALIGESGSGKTTAGKGIIRLLKPTSGEVYFEQKNLLKLPNSELHQVRSKLQIVFQDPFSSMNPRMLINDIIEEGMIAQNIGTHQQRQARVDELIKLVGLAPESKWRYPHEFSGGQRQRICIARSLAVNPALIICDEPTSSLDVSVQMQILQLLQRLQQQLKLSYLLITHNFSVVAYLADEVAVMYQGKIVEYGPVEQILHHPTHEYTKKLLASVPKVNRS
jgi:peptide/nickel transport system ATP-binding protein